MMCDVDGFKKQHNSPYVTYVFSYTHHPSETPRRAPIFRKTTTCINPCKQRIWPLATASSLLALVCQPTDNKIKPSIVLENPAEREAKKTQHSKPCGSALQWVWIWVVVQVVPLQTTAKASGFRPFHDPQLLAGRYEHSVNSIMFRVSAKERWESASQIKLL